jgi:hypothetical protein
VESVAAFAAWAVRFDSFFAGFHRQLFASAAFAAISKVA